MTLGMTRAQARSHYVSVSTHGYSYEDYFCLTPIGERVGYASDVLLKSLSASEANRLRGRVVLALVGNPYYALRGVRPGSSLSAAAKVLHPGAAIHVGLNYWYMAANGSTTAVLKVVDGRVQEIGIANAQVTHTHSAQIRFIRSFS